MGKSGALNQAIEVNEDVFIQFQFPLYGYEEGEIVRARVQLRDLLGFHVYVYSREHQEHVNAWSDLGSFRELTAMEIIAHAANGTLPELEHVDA